MAAHIPCRYESLVTYYGVYNSIHRGKLKRENREELLEHGIVVPNDLPKTTRSSQTSSLVKWIRRIFDKDPLICNE